MKKLLLPLILASMMIGCHPQDGKTASEQADNSEAKITFSEFDWNKVAKTSVADFTSIELPEGMTVIGKATDDTEQFSRFSPSIILNLYDGHTAHHEVGDLTYFDIGMIEEEQTFDKKRFDAEMHQYMELLDAVEIFNGVVPPDVRQALKAADGISYDDYMTGNTEKTKLRQYALNHEDGTQSFYQIVSDEQHGQLGILEVASSDIVVPVTEQPNSQAHINGVAAEQTSSSQVLPNQVSPNQVLSTNDTAKDSSVSNEQLPINADNAEVVIPTASQLKNQLDASGKAIININFDSGYSTIRQDNQPIMDEIYNLLTDNPDLRLIIEGHTDNVGKAKSNHRLSQRRANRVKYALVQRGISGKRLKSKGYGESKPIVDNDSEQNRVKNRRIELVKF